MDISKHVRNELREMGIICPACGSDVVLREPRPGGKRFLPFYGCSTYPQCDATLSTDEVGVIASGGPDEWEPPARDWGDL